MQTNDKRDGIDPGKTQMHASGPLGERLQRAVDKTLCCGGSQAAQKIRNFLNGTWPGELLHVVLTDAPISL